MIAVCLALIVMGQSGDTPGVPADAQSPSPRPETASEQHAAEPEATAEPQSTDPSASPAGPGDGSEHSTPGSATPTPAGHSPTAESPSVPASAAPSSCLPCTPTPAPGPRRLSPATAALLGAGVGFGTGHYYADRDGQGFAFSAIDVGAWGGLTVAMVMLTREVIANDFATELSLKLGERRATDRERTLVVTSWIFTGLVALSRVAQGITAYRAIAAGSPPPPPPLGNPGSF